MAMRAGANELLDLGVEALHAVELAVAHGIEQRPPLVVAGLHVVARPHRGLEDLQHRHAPAALLRHQPLRDEVAERGRQPRRARCAARRRRRRRRCAPRSSRRRWCGASRRPGARFPPRSTRCRWFRGRASRRRGSPSAPGAAPPRSAAANVGVSACSSRWWTVPFLCGCRNSIGSSMVRMCSARVSLMRSMIAASVDDLPEPVWPVTRTMPFLSDTTFSSDAGRPSSARLGMRDAMTRMTTAKLPRCRKTLTRNRVRSESANDRSQAPCSLQRAQRRARCRRSDRAPPARCPSARMIAQAGTSTGRSSPWRSTWGGRPGEKIRSLMPGAGIEHRRDQRGRRDHGLRGQHAEQLRFVRNVDEWVGDGRHSPRYRPRRSRLDRASARSCARWRSISVPTDARRVSRPEPRLRRACRCRAPTRSSDGLAPGRRARAC